MVELESLREKVMDHLKIGEESLYIRVKLILIQTENEDEDL